METEKLPENFLKVVLNKRENNKESELIRKKRTKWVSEWTK